MTLNPWDRQPKEPDSAWEAFTIYRDLGPAERSTAKVAQTLSKSKAMTDRWSGSHGWVERAAAWDSHLDKAVQARLKAREVDRRIRQASLGRGMQAVAGQGLQRMVDSTGQLTRPLKPNEIAQLAKAGFDIETVAEGDPSSRIDHTSPIGLDAVGQAILSDPVARDAALRLLEAASKKSPVKEDPT